jgi:hypothetical protein
MSSIPRKEVHAAAVNPSERGFPTHGKPTPDDQDAWSAPNNPVSKTQAEKDVWRKEWEGKTLDGRGAGTTGGRSACGTGEGAENVAQHLTHEQWEKQEGQLGQGGKEAPAAEGPE